MIESSRKLMDEGGMDALSIGNIVAAAGQQRAMVNYYFGSKDVLIEAVVESILHDISQELAKAASGLPQGPLRAEAFIHKALDLMVTPDSLATLDIIPVARRKADIRSRVAEIYAELREVTIECLSTEAAEHPDRRLAALGSIITAVVDGLSIQWTLDPEALDIETIAQVLEEVLTILIPAPDDPPRAGAAGGA